MEHYLMPRAYQGMGVLWYHGGDKSLRPYFGLVTQVGPRTVTVAAFDPGLRTLVIFDGVRHIKDPAAKQLELQESGAWEYAPGEQRLKYLEENLEKHISETQALKTQLMDLTKKLAELEKKVK